MEINYINCNGVKYEIGGSTSSGGIRYEYYDSPEEFPEKGETGVIYLVGIWHGTYQSYDEYVWVDYISDPINNGHIIGYEQIGISYNTMSASEAATGTSTVSRAISAKVLNDLIDAKLDKLKALIAREWQPNVEYDKSELVWHDGKLYQSNFNVNSNATFNSTRNFTETTIGQKFAGIQGDLDELG